MQISINSIVVVILILTHIIFFFMGYVLAKIGQNNGVFNTRPKSFFDQQHNDTKVSIDDKKYVVNISTDGLEKKYAQLGETKESSEKIDSAINKLKNMKG